MSNEDKRPWWSRPENGHMFTPGANQRVANVLMEFDNELTKAPQRLTETLSNIGEDHPEVSDTAVREFVGEAIEQIVIDFAEMMIGEELYPKADECSECGSPLSHATEPPSCTTERCQDDTPAGG